MKTYQFKQTSSGAVAVITASCRLSHEFIIGAPSKEALVAVLECLGINQMDPQRFQVVEVRRWTEPRPAKRHELTNHGAPLFPEKEAAQ